MLSRLDIQAEDVSSDDMIASMFLDIISDNVSNAEQNLQMAHSSQPKSSRASVDSADFANVTTKNRDSVWLPLDASVIALGDWPNSNREQATSSNIKEWVENMNVSMTLEEITPPVSIKVDPLGSGVPVFSASRNALADTTDTPSENRLRKRKTKKEVNLQNYTLTTPSLLGPSALQLERTVTSQHSVSDSIASPSSIVTRGII